MGKLWETTTELEKKGKCPLSLPFCRLWQHTSKESIRTVRHGQFHVLLHFCQRAISWDWFQDVPRLDLPPLTSTLDLHLLCSWNALEGNAQSRRVSLEKHQEQDWFQTGLYSCLDWQLFFLLLMFQVIMNIRAGVTLSFKLCDLCWVVLKKKCIGRSPVFHVKLREGQHAKRLKEQVCVWECVVVDGSPDDNGPVVSVSSNLHAPRVFPPSLLQLQLASTWKDTIPARFLFYVVEWPQLSLEDTDLPIRCDYCFPSTTEFSFFTQTKIWQVPNQINVLMRQYTEMGVCFRLRNSLKCCNLSKNGKSPTCYQTFQRAIVTRAWPTPAEYRTLYLGFCSVGDGLLGDMRPLLWRFLYRDSTFEHKHTQVPCSCHNVNLSDGCFHWFYLLQFSIKNWKSVPILGVQCWPTTHEPSKASTAPKYGHMNQTQPETSTGHVPSPSYSTCTRKTPRTSRSQHSHNIFSKFPKFPHHLLLFLSFQKY